MSSAPSPAFSLNITTQDRKSYTLKFSIKSEKLDIQITNNSSLALSYNASFSSEELSKLNRFFRQFDTISEIYDFLINIEKPGENIVLKPEDNFINLKLTLPTVLKNQQKNELTLVLPEVKMKESDLIVKLCHQVEKIDILEKKINYIFYCLEKTEKDFKYYEDLPEKLKNNVAGSKIIAPEDFITVQFGVQKKLKKNIKEIKLLYRASRDGDSTQFHTKCDGIENTATFVKSTNGRKFGGFANKSFNTNNQWISDPNCFVFSLDNKECYYYNNNGNMIYGSSSYGPVWGAGNDIYMASGGLSKSSGGTNQSSFDYKGKSNALSGSTSFQAVDYETYQLILE